jgi:hypothetical protein
MSLSDWLFELGGKVLYEKLNLRLNELKELIMATKEEVLETLQGIHTLLQEVASETDASLAKITELEALVAQGGVSQEIVDKVAEIRANLQVVADKVPNAVEQVSDMT